MKNNPKLDRAMFFINALLYEGAKRKEIVETLVVELGISCTNAAYYVDRVYKRK